MLGSSGRSALMSTNTPTVRTVILRVAEKLHETVVMAQRIQQTLDLAGTNAPDPQQIRFLQDLDRIEQTVRDCASLLRALTPQISQDAVDPAPLIAELQLQEIKDLLMVHPNRETPQNGAVQWL